MQCWYTYWCCRFNLWGSSKTIEKECHNRDQQNLNFLFQPLPVTLKEKPYAFSISCLTTKGSFGPKNSRGNKVFSFFDLSKELTSLGDHSVVRYVAKVVLNNGENLIMGRLFESPLLISIRLLETQKGKLLLIKY